MFVEKILYLMSERLDDDDEVYCHIGVAQHKWSVRDGLKYGVVYRKRGIVVGVWSDGVILIYLFSPGDFWWYLLMLLVLSDMLLTGGRLFAGN